MYSTSWRKERMARSLTGNFCNEEPTRKERNTCKRNFRYIDTASTRAGQDKLTMRATMRAAVDAPQSQGRLCECCGIDPKASGLH